MNYQVFTEKPSALKNETLVGEYDEYNMTEMGKDIGKEVATALKNQETLTVLVKEKRGKKKVITTRVKVEMVE